MRNIITLLFSLLSMLLFLSCGSGSGGGGESYTPQSAHRITVYSNEQGSYTLNRDVSYQTIANLPQGFSQNGNILNYDKPPVSHTFTSVVSGLGTETIQIHVLDPNTGSGVLPTQTSTKLDDGINGITSSNIVPFYYNGKMYGTLTHYPKYGYSEQYMRILNLTDQTVYDVNSGSWGRHVINLLHKGVVHGDYFYMATADYDEPGLQNVLTRFHMINKTWEMDVAFQTSNCRYDSGGSRIVESPDGLIWMQCYNPDNNTATLKWYDPVNSIEGEYVGLPREGSVDGMAVDEHYVYYVTNPYDYHHLIAVKRQQANETNGTTVSNAAIHYPFANNIYAPTNADKIKESPYQMGIGAGIDEQGVRYYFNKTDGSITTGTPDWDTSGINNNYVGAQFPSDTIPAYFTRWSYDTTYTRPSVQNGTGIARYKFDSNDPWTDIEIPNIKTYLEDYKYLLPFNQDKLFAAGDDYLGYKVLDPNTPSNSFQANMIDPSPISNYWGIEYNNHIFYSGYPSSMLFMYDINAPWENTYINGTTDLDASYAQTNPKFLGYIGGSTNNEGIHKVYTGDSRGNTLYMTGGRNRAGDKLVVMPINMDKAISGASEAEYRLARIAVEEGVPHVVGTIYGLQVTQNYMAVANHDSVSGHFIDVYDNSNRLVHTFRPPTTPQNSYYGLKRGDQAEDTIYYAYAEANTHNARIIKYDLNKRRIVWNSDLKLQFYMGGANNEGRDNFFYAEDGFLYLSGRNDIENIVVRIDNKTGKFEYVYRLPHLPSALIGSPVNKLYYKDYDSTAVYQLDASYLIQAP